MNLAMATNHHFKTKAWLKLFLMHWYPWYAFGSPASNAKLLFVSLLIAESSTSSSMDEKQVRSKRPMSRMEVCVSLFLVYCQNSNSMQFPTTCCENIHIVITVVWLSQVPSHISSKDGYRDCEVLFYLFSCLCIKIYFVLSPYE